MADEIQEYRKGHLAGEPAFDPIPEPVCEWKYSRDNFDWETDCGEKSWDWNFCPYCGRKLVEVKE